MVISPFNPLYVVQQYTEEETRYYKSRMQLEEGAADVSEDDMDPSPKHAMLFVRLESAARVADALSAEVRVLYNKSHLREFGR